MWAFVGGRGFRYPQKYEFSSRNNCFPSNTFNLNAFVCINGFQRYQLFFKQEPSGPKSQRHFRPCCKISLQFFFGSATNLKKIKLAPTGLKKSKAEPSDGKTRLASCYLVGQQQRARLVLLRSWVQDPPLFLFNLYLSVVCPKQV